MVINAMVMSDDIRLVFKFGCDVSCCVESLCVWALLLFGRSVVSLCL